MTERRRVMFTPEGDTRGPMTSEKPVTFDGQPCFGETLTADCLEGQIIQARKLAKKLGWGGRVAPIALIGCYHVIERNNFWKRIQILLSRFKA